MDVSRELKWCPHHEEPEIMTFCRMCSFWFCPFFYGKHCPRCGENIKVEKKELVPLT